MKSKIRFAPRFKINNLTILKAIIDRTVPFLEHPRLIKTDQKKQELLKFKNFKPHLYT